MTTIRFLLFIITIFHKSSQTKTYWIIYFPCTLNQKYGSTFAQALLILGTPTARQMRLPMDIVAISRAISKTLTFRTTGTCRYDSKKTLSWKCTVFNHPQTCYIGCHGNPATMSSSSQWKYYHPSMAPSVNHAPNITLIRLIISHYI